MNCEEIWLILNAALDNELSAAENEALQGHLEICPACREQATELQVINNSLSEAIQSPATDSFVERVMRAVSAENIAPISSCANHHSGETVIPATARVNGARPISRFRNYPKVPYRRSSGTILLLVGSLFCTFAVLMNLPAATPVVAEILRATGPVDLMRVNSNKWIPLEGTSRISLPADSRVRTGPMSLCEIRTKSDALVRVNQQTELIVKGAEHVELVSGEIWCRASAKTDFEISSEQQLPKNSSETMFTCPSSSETQWQAAPNQELRCVAVSTSPVELKMISPGASCTVQPGQALSFSDDGDVTPSAASDRLTALNWQLPLLALRSADDMELQQRLAQLLASAGQSKLSYLYEDQIRRLGPAGTIPLISFVKSNESHQQPDLRYRAMEIIADLGPQSIVKDLENLLNDDDTRVRMIAQRALQRLQPSRTFEDQAKQSDR